MNSIGTTRIARAAAAICAVGVLTLSAAAADLAHLRNGFTIRHEHRAAVGENTRLFLSADDTSYLDVPTAEIEAFETEPDPPASPHATPPGTASAADLNQIVNSASAAYHLDPDLVNSVIRAESGFNARAVSRKGAQGLMQLMPDTASRLGVVDAFDPMANVGGGSRYLRELIERYHFDLVKALAAYNAGPQKVELFRGVPPYRETRAYVARIVRDYNKKKIAQEKQAAAARGSGKSGQQLGTIAAPPQSPR
jgi:soluble lytic murein transglycosylase-like protein